METVLYGGLGGFHDGETGFEGVFEFGIAFHGLECPRGDFGSFAE